MISEMPENNVTGGEVQTPEPSVAESMFDVNKWQKRFSDSEKTMRQEFLPQYRLAKDRLHCRFNRMYSSRPESRVTHEQVNLVYSIGSNYINSVYFKSPNCNLRAREETDREKIENTEIKINDWLQDAKVARTVKRILWDAYLGGFGARVMFYHYDDKDSDEPIMQPTETVDPITGEIVQGEAPMIGPDGMPVMKKIVLRNEIVLKRCRPDLARFPKGFDFENFQESPWIGLVMLLTKDEVERENWPKELKDKLKYVKYEKASGTDGRDSGYGGSSSEEYCKINYLYEKKDRMMLTIFSDDLPRPLEEREETSGIVGYPVKFIYHNPLDDDTSYPNGDPFIWEPQLRAIDQWWALMTEHTARSLPQRFYDSGRVKKSEISRSKSSRMLEYIGIENKERADLRSLFYDKEKPPMHPDISRFYEISRQLLNEISPKTGLMRGASDSAPGSATEAKIMATGEAIDIDARVDDIKNFITDIVLDCAGILTNGLVAPVTIRREIDGVGEVFNDVNRDGFTDKINVDVDTESMQARNKDVLRRQIIDSIKTMTALEPILNKSGKTINGEYWIDELVSVLTLRNAENAIMDLPPPPAMPVIPPEGQQEGAGAPASSVGESMPPEAVENALAMRT